MYFAESYPSQLMNGGIGFGTFDLDETIPQARLAKTSLFVNATAADSSLGGLVQSVHIDLS